MLRFRIFILKDPDAENRGYSFKGIKVPLTTFCPIESRPSMQSLDGSSAYGPYIDYWKIPVDLLCKAKPSLSSHLRGLDFIYIPTEWADVGPVLSYDNM